MNARLLDLLLWLTLSFYAAIVLPALRAMFDGRPYGRAIVSLWRWTPAWFGVLSLVLAATTPPDATVPPGNDQLNFVRFMLPVSSVLALRRLAGAWYWRRRGGTPIAERDAPGRIP